MKDQTYTDPATLRRLRTGVLGPYIDSFADLLSDLGYARRTMRCQLRLVADLSHWLQARGLAVQNLNEDKIRESLEELPRNGEFIHHYGAVFRILLEHLRDLGLTPAPKPKIDDSAIGRLVDEFRRYLLQECGLCEATGDCYVLWIRRFLSERFGANPLLLSELSSCEVTQFVLRHARDISIQTSKGMVTALRSFFRFLRLRGEVNIDLTSAVPTVADWRLSSLPKSLEPEQVERLLKCCNPSSRPRDYAILLLLARLGLRGGEVVAMRLEDIDWEAGVLTVRGKGSRQDHLPIPYEVGKALATYLCEGRPQCKSRRVFITSKAPLRGLTHSNVICGIMRRALARAGLNPDRKGAHLLRHSLASNMLRKGASLGEIGQILRHQSVSTTQIYAKVDLAGLREIAQPWPGGEA